MTHRRLLVLFAAVIMLVTCVVGAGNAEATPPPSLSSMSPNHGTDAGGTYISIYGHGFTHVTSVRFGGVSGSHLHVLSSTHLSVRSPRHVDGIVNVRVLTTHGRSAVVWPDRFTFYPLVHWRAALPTGAGELDAVSCPAANRCVAVGNGDAVVLHGWTWSAPVHVAPELDDVSCATATHCVAVGGTYYSVWDSGTWSAPLTADPNGAGALACPSVTFCVVVDAFGQYTTFDGTSWTAPQDVPNNDFQDGMVSVACHTAAFCIGTDVDGVVYNIRGALAGSWSGLTSEPQLDRLTCTSSTYCAAIDDGRPAIWAHTASGWHGTNVAVPHGAHLSGLSCVPSFCAAVDDHGYTYSKGPGAYSPPVRVTTVAGGFADVDCASVHFCVAVGPSGRASIGTR